MHAWKRRENAGAAPGLAPRRRPASDESNAHSAPRLWPGSNRQVVRFNDPVHPGVVEHYCGDAPCSASNPGSWE